MKTAGANTGKRAKHAVRTDTAAAAPNNVAPDCFTYDHDSVPGAPLARKLWAHWLMGSGRNCAMVSVVRSTWCAAVGTVPRLDAEAVMDAMDAISSTLLNATGHALVNGAKSSGVGIVNRSGTRSKDGGRGRDTG